MAKLTIDTSKVKGTEHTVLHLDEKVLVIALPITSTELSSTGKSVIRYKSSGYRKLNDNLSFNGVVTAKVATPKPAKKVKETATPSIEQLFAAFMAQQGK